MLCLAFESCIACPWVWDVGSENGIWSWRWKWKDYSGIDCYKYLQWFCSLGVGGERERQTWWFPLLLDTAMKLRSHFCFLFFLTSSLQPTKKVRNASFLSFEISFFSMWLTAWEQSSKQSPLMCQRAHILTVLFHAVQSWGSCLAKLPFHDLPLVTLNSSGWKGFFTKLLFLLLFLRFFFLSLPPLPLPVLLLSFFSMFEAMTFSKVDGSNMWNVPLRTLLTMSSNWRMGLLTWVLEW